MTVSFDICVVLVMKFGCWPGDRREPAERPRIVLEGDLLRWFRALSRPLRASSTMARRAYALILHVNAVSDFLSFIATVAGFFGTGAATGAFNLPAIQVEKWAFPLRLVIFLLLASGMGWALGALMRRLRRFEREPRLLLSALAAVVISGMIAGCADWLGTPAAGRSIFPQLALLILLGTLCACRAAILSIRTSRGATAMGQIREASSILLVFTLASAAMLGLAELGVR